ncbi:zinc finger protein 37-like isoform X7, partial [Leptotrombidium deliense]
MAGTMLNFRVRTSFIVNIDNFFELLDIFSRFGCNKAIKQCFRFVDLKANDVILNESWFNKLPYSLLMRIIKRKSFHVEEWKKCKALLKWQKEHQEHTLKDIMSLINWSLISAEEMKTKLSELKDFYFNSDFNSASNDCTDVPPAEGIDVEEAKAELSPTEQNSVNEEGNCVNVTPTRDVIDIESDLSVLGDNSENDDNSILSGESDCESDAVVESIMEHTGEQAQQQAEPENTTPRRKRKRESFWFSEEKAKNLKYDETIKKHKCTICEDTFAVRNRALRHISTVHFGERPFECPVSNCSHKYSQKAPLKDHILSQHFGERFFDCTACNKQFLTARKLNDHFQRVHEKRDQCTCDYCGNTFTCKSSFLNHQKTKHK